MKRYDYLLLILILWLITACSTDTTPRTESDSAIPKTPALPILDTAALRQQLTALETELTTLKTHFTYQQRNLPVPSYYHKNWWDSYGIRDNALLAGVDSAGIFFLIDCYNCSLELIPDEVKQPAPRPACDSANSRLELRLKDTTITLMPRPRLIEKLWPHRNPPIERDLWIGTGQYCTDYYPLPDHPDLVHLLADTAVGYFKFYRYCNGRGFGDIGFAEKRDRTGIRDCARLSELIGEINALKRQLAGTPL